MVFGSLFDCENLKGLEKMGKEVEDVEEGEISDTASVEEITEEDFNKQDVKVNNNNNKPNGSDARVWAVHDLYSKYPTICRGYASGLYNLAWAQAVQNKPLNDIFVMELDSDGNANSNSNNSNRPSSGSVNSKEVVMVDVDKEEGELEEGEIDADADPEAEGETVVVSASETVADSEQLGLRDVLEGVTVANVAESFPQACYRLQNALPQVSSRPADPEKDGLVRLSFNAIEVVYSVFCSMETSEKEQNKDNILRLLSFVKDQQQAQLFSPEHIKEIQGMMIAIDSVGALSNRGAIGKEKELETHDIKMEDPSVEVAELISSSKHLHTDTIGALQVSKFGQNSIKGRGILLPLLDLHKDHDADSLPSPTREAPSCFPVNKLLSTGESLVIKSGSPTPITVAEKMELGSEDSKLHHYETDAFKAVSTYQQKFGRSSLFTNDKLPSPTPSGDCEDEVVDTNEEISSASTSGFLTSTKPILLDHQAVSATSMDRSGLQGLISSRVDTAGHGSYPVKSSSKSRDPRLRFINSDATAVDNQSTIIPNMPKVEYAGAIISRKQKAAEEPSLDVTVSKRQKSSLENAEHNMSEVRTAAGSGGWLEEITGPGAQLIERNHLMDKFGPEPRKTLNTVSSSCDGSANFNATSIRNEQAPVTSNNVTASLPALLKDIAVNPTMLLNILREQQLRLAEAKKKSADSATNVLHLTSLNSTMGTDSTVSIGSSMTTGVLHSSVGMHPVSSQSTSTAHSLQDDSGKIRMKPRDPRRILHSNNATQKSGCLGNEQFKVTVSPASNNQGTGDNIKVPKLEGRVDTKLVTSQSSAAPDIARQFTKNLKNIADIMSVSQESSNHSPAAQNFSSASVPLTLDRGEQKPVVSNSQNLQAGVGSANETGASGASRSQSTWGDVEHLFDGYDEQQKAAIQRERARRIDEQNKMFAARKLCLVLDLDHTLLNSAKFVEVDPVHEEILRKKEEQDREKPHRHLFRFPHMGMWTKLRPGIWNFLEKASKLYELHLYTMGNKLYATEMAKVLDPKGVLFAGRVISRGDDTDSGDGDERVPKSKDLEGVLGMESSVVIIDDSVRVWPHNKLNLIVVERYTYFPCSRRQFGLLGPSLLEIDHDERPEAGTLASSLAVIERIHQNFFASQSLEDVDVRNILASEQRKILAGCRIVFSRVFPTSLQNPHLHPLWQTAEQFGAVCTANIDDQVTHVVAHCLGTDKVNWALSTGRFVVHPGWVEASALLYRRANEQDFAIKP
ncbi:RNA polymerase II C-terminal domain phosphatase-like 3 [Cajanus cajan]|uniref:RNA polymerase II C-terminal domain phosphatase-like 3 n=1 Tax=Cajanus cajan TaxID=3821 RepID=UPI00098D888D|nr:RNA polymerase II C-terminal domain phosphatase-like 3 [Cajanus cajan]